MSGPSKRVPTLNTIINSPTFQVHHTVLLRFSSKQPKLFHYSTKHCIIKIALITVNQAHVTFTERYNALSCAVQGAKAE